MILGILWLILSIAWAFWVAPALCIAMIRKRYPQRLVAWLRRRSGRGLAVVVLLILPIGGQAVTVNHQFKFTRSSGHVTLKDTWESPADSITYFSYQIYPAQNASYRIDTDYIASGGSHSGVVTVGTFDAIPFGTTTPAGIIVHAVRQDMCCGQVYDEQTIFVTLPPDTGGDGPQYQPTTPAPPDLSVGIPGVGDITIPSGWLTQCITAAQEIAAAETGMSSQGLSNAFEALQTKTGMTGDLLKGKMTDMQTSLFTPQASEQQQFYDLLQQFINWGPFTYITTMLTTIRDNGAATTTTPAPPDTHIDTAPVFGGLYSQHGHVNGLGLAPHTATGGAATDGLISIPEMSVAVDDSIVVGSNGAQIVKGGQWYDTGRRVGFDFSPITNAPLYGFVRFMLGVSVYLTFGWAVMVKLQPKLHM